MIDSNRRMNEDFGNPVGRRCYTVFKGCSEACAECRRDHTVEEPLFDRR